MQRRDLVPSELNDQIFGRSVDQLTAKLIAQTNHYVNPSRPFGWIVTESERKEAKAFGLSLIGRNSKEAIAKIYPMLISPIILRSELDDKGYPKPDPKHKPIHLTHGLLSLYSEAICEFLNVSDVGENLGYAVCMYFGANKNELDDYISNYTARVTGTLSSWENRGMDMIARVNAVEMFFAKHFIPYPPFELEEIDSNQMRLA